MATIEANVKAFAEKYGLKYSKVTDTCFFLEKGTQGFEIEYNAGDPHFIGWSEVEITKTGKHVRWTSGADSIQCTLIVAKEYFCL